MVSKKGRSKKVTTKASKSKASKTSKSKSSKSASKTIKPATTLTQKVMSKKQVKRSSIVGKFVSAKTGRVVKGSASTPRLGKARIKTVVSGYMRETRRVAD